MPRTIRPAPAPFRRLIVSGSQPASSPSVGELDARHSASRPDEAGLAGRIAGEAVEDLELEVGGRQMVASPAMFAPVREMLRSVTSSDDEPLLKTQRAWRRRRTRGERPFSAQGGDGIDKG